MVKINRIFDKIKINWKNYLLILLIIIILGNLINNNEFNNSKIIQYSSNNIKNIPMAKSSLSGYNIDNSNPKIIKNANMNLEVDNFQNSINKVNDIFKNNNIIILRESFSKNYNDLNQVNYNLKIDSENLEKIIAQFKQIGDVKYLTINSNDVQKSFEDYSDRKQRYLYQIKKYKKMLNSSKLTIEDEIKIQQRIDSLEDSLFYIEKRMNNINEDVKYSNIYLTIQEKPSIIDDSNFLKLNDLSRLFLNSIANGFNFIIKLLGYALPYLILFVLYLLFRKISIKFYKN